MIYLLITGVLALVIGLLCGLVLAMAFARRGRRLRLRAVSLPMFRERPSPTRLRKLRARKAAKAAAAPVTIRLKPGHANRRRLALLLAALVALAGGGLLIYNTTLTRVLAERAATVELAVQLPLSGEAAASGIPPSEGIQLAIDEANASDQGPTFTLATYDDQGNNELARGVADQIVASQALLVLGPAFSTTALTTGPAYATADMVSLPTNATSDQITTNRTTFRVLFKNSDQGELLANYLVRVLGQKRAAVFVVDTAYGNTLREGFERAAAALGVQGDYYVFSDEAEARELANQVAGSQEPPPVVLLTLDREGAKLLITLRRLGVAGPFLGGDSFGKDAFLALVENQPEERSQPGFFTDQLYAVAPMILDSANAETLAFAERYRARFGRDPDWSAVAGYDAASLAIAAVRATATDPAVSRDLPARREALDNYLRGLSSPEQALPGLLGPFWFDEDRGRPLAIRVGRFRGGRLVSAPIQIVSVQAPDPTELAAGTVFELGPGRHGRLQLVAHTGVFVNEIAQVDAHRSRFSADFYLWMRFADAAGVGDIDPANLRFPAMVSGDFDRSQPLQRRVLEDGSEYRLWRVRGEFHGAFDLRRFPFDRQSLALAFVNGNATADQLVYAVDQQATEGEAVLPRVTAGASATPVAQATAAPPEGDLAAAAPEAFRSLGEWAVYSAHARRETQITEATLGDPARGESNSRLELSGFAMTVELERRASSAYTNTVLPLIALSLVLFGSLFLPITHVKAKLLVAVIAALCGVVPLVAINSQVGPVGYTVPIVNVFYAYFGLALACGIGALWAERMRALGWGRAAARVAVGTRIIFGVGVVATVALTTLFMWR